MRFQPVDKNDAKMHQDLLIFNIKNVIIPTCTVFRTAYCRGLITLITMALMLHLELYSAVSYKNFQCSLLASAPAWEIWFGTHSICCTAAQCLSEMGCHR